MVTCILDVETNTNYNPLGLRILDGDRVVYDDLVKSKFSTIEFILDDSTINNIKPGCISFEVYGKNESHCVGDIEDHGHIIIKQLKIGNAVLISETNFHQYVIDNLSYTTESGTQNYTTFLGQNGTVTLPITKPIFYWIATEILS